MICRYLTNVGERGACGINMNYFYPKDLIYMKKTIASAALAACVLLSGCASTDIRPEEVSNASDLIEQLVTNPNVSTASAAESAQEFPEEAVNDSSVPQAPVAPTAEVTTTPDADSDFDVFYDEVHQQFELSDEELSFLDYSLIVGDSICSGFAEYGIVPRERVAAKGNLGARSFFDYTFRFRGRDEQTYDQVMKAANPRYVFLSMGMNDVNMVDENRFCEDYRRIIQATLDGTRADVFVAAITPVCSKFCANSVIDSFNETLKSFIAEEFPERVHFLDFGRYLKNDQNKLRECLHSGDGVHLGPYSYYIGLWEMHRALMEAGLWEDTQPTGTFDAEDFQPTVPVINTSAATSAEEKPEEAPAETTKPAKTEKTTAPAKTTAKTTKPAKTTAKSTKPEKTTAEPETTSKPETQKPESTTAEPEKTTAAVTAPEPTEIPVEVEPTTEQIPVSEPAQPAEQFSEEAIAVEDTNE